MHDVQTSDVDVLKKNNKEGDALANNGACLLHVGTRVVCSFWCGCTFK
jgi:hypothetical protein